MDQFLIGLAVSRHLQNQDCDYVSGMRPDQRRGWYDECRANTRKSALILAGVI